MSAAILTATLSSGVSQLGLASSFVYHRGVGELFDYRFLIHISVLSIGALSLVFAYAGLGVLYPAGFSYNTLLVVMLSLSMAIFTYLNTISQTHSDLHLFNLSRAAVPLSMMVFLGIMFVSSVYIDYEDVLMFQIMVTSAVTILCVCVINRQLARSGVDIASRWSALPKIINYGWKHFGTQLLSLVLLNLDKIFLMRIVQPAEFGIYALAFATTRPLAAAQDAAAVATMSRFVGKSDELLSDAVTRGFRVTFMPMLFLAVSVVAISPFVVPLFFGSAFEPMVVPFSLLAIEAVLGGASWVLAQRFTASGQPGVVLTRQVITVIPLLLMLPLIPSHNSSTYLSGLMLLMAFLRLVVTMAMYPLLLGEKIPRIFPDFDDVRSAFRTFSQNGR